MELIIERLIMEGHAYLRLSGELNYEGVGQLRSNVQAALDEGQTRIILNIEGLNLISSYGLSAILKLHKLLKEKQGILIVTSPKGHVAEVFTVTGISQVIPLYFSDAEMWKQIALRKE